MAISEGAVRSAETLLRMAGRAVTVRVGQAASSPPMEVVLKPCLLKWSGEAAELLVAAGAVTDVAGLAEELFSISSRVAVDDIVWRVVSYAAMECGENVLCWRVLLAR